MRKETMKHKILNLLTNLKNEKGATGADIVVALSIIVLTVSVISMVYINLTNGSKNVNRTAGATRIATNILENIDKMSYEQYNKTFEDLTKKTEDGWGVSEDKTTVTFDPKKKTTQGTEKIFETKIPKGYKVELISQNIYPEGVALPKYDLIKKINVKVTFTVSKTEQNVSLYTSKEREQLAEVNKPDIDSLNISGKSYVPIKYSTTQKAYVVTDEKDADWYNYSNKVWAMAYVDSLDNIAEIKKAGKLTDAQANTTGNIYYWIPRFSTDKQALYHASNYPITNIQIKTDDETQEMSIFSVGTSEVELEGGESFNGKKGLWKAKSELNSASETIVKIFNKTKFGPVQY